MPKLQRSNIPEALFRHLLLRVRQREITVADLEQFYHWIQANPTVPEGAWYKRFQNFTLCGQDHFVKTFLEFNRTPVGKEII